MTATNHALTGAIIGLSLSNPYLAIVLAFVSHFALDALPHFDFAAGRNSDEHLRTKAFKIYLILNFISCVLLVIFLIIFNSINWLLPSTCAFVAASPDLFSINHYLSVIKGRKWKPNRFMKLSGAIQWFQRPIGAFVEIAWSISAIVILHFLIT